MTPTGVSDGQGHAIHQRVRHADGARCDGPMVNFTLGLISISSIFIRQVVLFQLSST